MKSTKFAAILVLAVSTSFAQKKVDKPIPKIDALHDFSAQLEELAHRVNQSVVQIFSTGYVLNDDRQSGSNAAIVTRQQATGSGVVVSADGFIVTNAHVVSNARTVRVRLADAGSGEAGGAMSPLGKMLPATVVGVDRDTDLAVIRVDRSDLTPLTLGDSDSLRRSSMAPPGSDVATSALNVGP